MESHTFLFMAFTIIVVTLVYNHFYSREAVMKRMLRQTKEKPWFELQEGDITKLQGNILYKGKTLIAPLSGRKCVYYYILVEQLHNHKNRSHWSVLIEEEKSGDVIINQDDHYALIKTELIHSHLVMDENYESGFMNDASDRMKNYLEKHGHTSTNFFGWNKSIRYKEGILEQGETVAIVGKASWKERKEVRLDIPGEKILVIESHLQEPVYLTDDPSMTIQSSDENL